MNKGELINAVAAAGLSKKDAALAVDTVLGTIGNELAKGETVTLLGFGTFSVKDRPAREGFNPSKKEKIQIAASRVPAFKAGKGLREKVK